MASSGRPRPAGRSISGRLSITDQPRDIALPSDQRTIDRCFNTDNFEKSSTKAPTGYDRRVFPNRFNWLRGDGVGQLDANIQKAIPMTERVRLEFRVDLLNALNNQQLSGPNTDPTSASFGRISSISNIPRYIQFQLRLVY